MLRFSACSLPPFYIPYKEGNRTRVKGIMGPLIEFTIASLNTSYVIIESGENSIGHEISPGNWSSAIGMLLRDEADIFAGTFCPIEELFPYAGFSTAWDTVDCRVLSGPPRKTSKRQPSFISAVGLYVWIGLGISWTLLSVFYWYISRIERNLDIAERIDDDLVSCLLTFYGLMFQRGFENLPSTTCRRIWVTGWLILVMVISTELGGILSSSLITMDVPERIDDLQDILKYPQLKPYVVKGVLADDHLRASTDKVKSSVWNKIKKFDGIQGLDVIREKSTLDEVNRGDAVVISSAGLVLASVASYDCQQQVRPYYMSKEPFTWSSLLFTYRKNLDPPLAEKLNIIAMNFGSMGFHLQMWEESSKYAGPCFEMGLARTPSSAMTLPDFIRATKLLAMGILVATGAALLELVYFYFVKERWRKAFVGNRNKITNLYE